TRDASATRRGGTVPRNRGLRSPPRPFSVVRTVASPFRSTGVTMAEVVLFHHAQGLTSGVQQFADELRAAGHTVHVPDMYNGNTFDDLDAGIEYARDTGFATIQQRGLEAADGLGEGVVFAGFSLGAMPAQHLAQTRPGATGALLFHAC